MSNFFNIPGIVCWDMKIAASRVRVFSRISCNFAVDMKTTPILTTEQRQQQHMLPQQVQYVRLLEMNGPEVEEAVRQAVDENPALEEVHDLDTSDDTNDFNETAEEVQMADYSGDEVPWYRLEAPNHMSDQRYYEPQAVASSSSLMDQLTDQLTDLDLDDLDRRIAHYIIGNLDDNGYMTRTVPELTSDLAIAGIVDDEKRVRNVWRQIRSLEPAGVGAMDLRDSLLLQLQRLKPIESVSDAKEIVKDYFDLFSKKHYDKLSKMLALTPERLKAAVEVIRRLNPKPGGIVGGSPDDERQRQIVPEFSVDVDGDHLTVTLLTAIPELRVSPTFSVDAYPHASDSAMTPHKAETNAFIKQRRDEATGFMRTLQMRQDTLLSVMRAIVTLQRDFFRTGDRTDLHPMILKDIASVTGLDASVISRATASKYVMTPYGTFPLKFFFNERPKESDPDTTSHIIEQKIRKVIDAENKHHPLSDEAITALLKEDGLDMARRTVTKYRERMNIPVARLRRTI